MKKFKQTLFTSILLAALCFLVVPVEQVFALTGCGSSNTEICKTDTNLFGGILKDVINVLLYFAGAIAVIMIVVGGIRYITSDGDPGAAGKAKNTIIFAIVGVIIATMSYSIVNFVIGRI